MMLRYHIVMPFADVNRLRWFREVSKGWTIFNQEGEALGIMLDLSRAAGIISIPLLHCLQNCKLRAFAKRGEGDPV